MRKSKSQKAALCGVLAAVTGFFMVSNAGYAIFTQGNGLSTLPISCCVIGGIKMAGGKGTAIHILLGALIMRVISQMMSAMFLPADRVNLITGILLLFSACGGFFRYLAHRRLERLADEAAELAKAQAAQAGKEDTPHAG